MTPNRQIFLNSLTLDQQYLRNKIKSWRVAISDKKYQINTIGKYIAEDKVKFLRELKYLKQSLSIARQLQAKQDGYFNTTPLILHKEGEDTFLVCYHCRNKLRNIATISPNPTFCSNCGRRLLYRRPRR